MLYFVLQISKTAIVKFTRFFQPAADRFNSCQSRDTIVQKNTSWWVSEMKEPAALYFLKKYIYVTRRNFQINKSFRKKKDLNFVSAERQWLCAVCEASLKKVKRPDRVMIKTVISVRQITFLLHNIVYKLISPDQKRRLHLRSIFKDS